MPNVDFKSDTYTLYYIWNYHVKNADFSSIIHLDTFSVHGGVKCPVLYTHIKNKWYRWAL